MWESAFHACESFEELSRLAVEVKLAGPLCFREDSHTYSRNLRSFTTRSSRHLLIFQNVLCRKSSKSFSLVAAKPTKAADFRELSNEDIEKEIRACQMAYWQTRLKQNQREVSRLPHVYGSLLGLNLEGLRLWKWKRLD